MARSPKVPFLLAETSDRAMFKSIETVDGSTNTSGIEFILQKEDDGQWLVSQERILLDDELKVINAEALCKA